MAGSKAAAAASVGGGEGDVKQMLLEVTEVCAKLEASGEYLESLAFQVRAMQTCLRLYGEGSVEAEDRYLRVAGLNLTLAQEHLDRDGPGSPEVARYLGALESLTARPLRHAESNRRRLLHRARLFDLLSVTKRHANKASAALRYGEKAALLFLHLDAVRHVPRCLLNVSAINSSLGLHPLALRYACAALQAVQTLRSEAHPTLHAPLPRAAQARAEAEAEAASAPDALLQKLESTGLAAARTDADRDAAHPSEGGADSPVAAAAAAAAAASSALRELRLLREVVREGLQLPRRGCGGDAYEDDDSCWPSTYYRQLTKVQRERVGVVWEALLPSGGEEIEEEREEEEEEGVVEAAASPEGNAEGSGVEALVGEPAEEARAPAPAPAATRSDAAEEEEEERAAAWTAALRERKAERLLRLGEAGFKMSLAQGDHSQRSYFSAVRLQCWARMLAAKRRAEELRRRRRGRPPPPAPTGPDGAAQAASGEDAEERDTQVLLGLCYHAVGVEQEHCGEFDLHLDSYQLAAFTVADAVGRAHPLSRKFRRALRLATAAQRRRDCGEADGDAAAAAPAATAGEKRRAAHLAAALYTRRQPTLAEPQKARTTRPQAKRCRHLAGSPAAAMLRGGAPRGRYGEADARKADQERYARLRRRQEERDEVERAMGLRPPAQEESAVVAAAKRAAPVARARRGPPPQAAAAAAAPPKVSEAQAPIAAAVARAHTVERIGQYAAEAGERPTAALTLRQREVTSAHDAWIRTTLQSDVTAELGLSESDVAFLSSTYGLALSTRPLASRTQHHAAREESSVLLDAIRRRMIQQREEAATWLKQLRQQPVAGH